MWNCVDVALAVWRFQGNTKEASYAVGLQGIKESDVEKVTQIINQTLDQVIK